MSEEPVAEPMVTLGDIEALLRENEEEAIKRIKARMACCALGLIEMSTEEVACCRALLNKHQADAKATEPPQTLNVHLNGVVTFVEPVKAQERIGAYGDTSGGASG